MEVRERCMRVREEVNGDRGKDEMGNAKDEKGQWRSE